MLPTNPTAIDFLLDVVRQGLNLADARVNVYNQKFLIPNDPYLFVGVEYKFSKIFASKSETPNCGTGVFQEKQGLNTQEHYSVILFSRNLDALSRKEEAVMALGSVYARQQGDTYGFRIARIAPIQDLSGLEGAAILYKLEIDVVMLCRYEKIKSIPWYSTFAGRITVEDGGDVTTDFQPAKH